MRLLANSQPTTDQACRIAFQVGTGLAQLHALRQVHGDVQPAHIWLTGEGDAKQTRFAVSDDGLLVTYSTAKKSMFLVHPLTLTLPDGTVEMDFPEERTDLTEIADRLKQPLKIEYETPNEIAHP